MDLFTAATVVTLGIAVSCLVPHFSPWLRNHSRALLVLGTVVLLGFVVFDLVPEMIEVGGATSVLLIAVSWAVFSGIHALQPSHEDTHHGELHSHLDAKQHHSIAFLLGSMALHCFAGGMLLVSSYSVSQSLAASVFLSLVAHKAFEAISLSSMMIERIRSRRHLYLCVAIYALSFPLGVAVTWGIEAAFAADLSAETVERVAMIITSIAVGSLFGCLLQDFLLPSLRDLKRGVLKPGQV